MKKMILTVLTIAFVSTTLLTQAHASSTDQIKAQNDTEAGALVNVESVEHAFSKEAQTDAKVISVLYGEGVNPYSLFLVLTAEGSSQIFKIMTNSMGAKKVAFTGKDEVTVTYDETTILNVGRIHDKEVTVEREQKYKIQRNTDGEVSDQLLVLK